MYGVENPNVWMVRKGGGLASLALANRVVASTSLRLLKRGHKVDLPLKVAYEPYAPGAKHLPPGERASVMFTHNC